MNNKPLDDLEMHELLRLMYPEQIRSDGDDDFELSVDIGEQAVYIGDDYETTLAELLGRVVMLTMPMQAARSGMFFHSLGEIAVNGDSVSMVAAVRRKVDMKKEGEK